MDARRRPALTRTPLPRLTRGLTIGASWWAVSSAVWWAAVLPLASCEAPPPSVGWHGANHQLASFSGGTLYSTLPEEVPVQSVIAAGEMALERRGYVVTASESTDDAGRVVARPGDPNLLRKITIESRLVQGGTSVSVRTNPGGNEHISRDIFERMLTRLGM